MDFVLQAAAVSWQAPCFRVCFIPCPHLLQTDCPKAECFETLSAMELAEQITLLDHIIFRSIPYEWVCPHSSRAALQLTLFLSRCVCAELWLLVLCWFCPTWMSFGSTICWKYLYRNIGNSQDGQSCVSVCATVTIEGEVLCPLTSLCYRNRNTV